MKKTNRKKSNRSPLLLLLPIVAVVIALPVFLTILVEAPVGNTNPQTETAITADGNPFADDSSGGGADADIIRDGASYGMNDHNTDHGDGVYDGNTPGDAADQGDSSAHGTDLPNASAPSFQEELASGWEQAFSLSDVPAYSGDLYTVIHDNIPFFSKRTDAVESFEHYAELDSLGRCGTACANVGSDLMPTEPRGEIGQVRPSGWHTVKYDGIDGNYLYNRCHLIAYQLSGENANVCNLITGTRSFNASGMLPFEEMVGNYVRETGHHVLYRVTPMFRGNNLVADGVLMEAWSVEDRGEGICFNVFVYNVQSGIIIDYATGDSCADSGIYLADNGDSTQNNAAGSESSANTDNSSTSPNASDGNAPNTDGGNAPNTDGGNAPNTDGGMNTPTTQPPAVTTAPEPQENAAPNYILNTNTHKFHYPTCSSVQEMSERNKLPYTGTRDEVIAMGYVPCKRCNP